MEREFDVVIQEDEDGGYIASVPELPGCHTQGETMEEVLSNVREAIELYLDVKGPPDGTSRVVGLQRVVVKT